jgi:hypothetical protein
MRGEMLAVAIGTNVRFDDLPASTCCSLSMRSLRACSFSRVRRVARSSASRWNRSIQPSHSGCAKVGDDGPTPIAAAGGDGGDNASPATTISSGPNASPWPSIITPLISALCPGSCSLLRNSRTATKSLLASLMLVRATNSAIIFPPFSLCAWQRDRFVLTLMMNGSCTGAVRGGGCYVARGGCFQRAVRC